MKSEIARLEELKQAEIQLMQQVYEQKINYLNTKLQLLTKEVSKKDSEIMTFTQQNPTSSKVKTEQSQRDLEAEKQYQREYLQALQLEKEQEVMKLKNQYAQDISNCQNLLKNRDRIIEQLSGELQQYRQQSLKFMDNQKIQYLSQILDLSSELQLLL